LVIKPAELLLRLMYSSVSAPELTQKALAEILEASVRHNHRDHITGALVANGAQMIQYLEGPAGAVHKLWTRIQADTRHHSIVQLYEQEVHAMRLFPKWPMLRGHASKQEMLAMVRSAYLLADTPAKPDWAQSIGPLMILLDGEFSYAYTGEDSDSEGR
jgi:Sensors of blue-light using FAD